MTHGSLPCWACGIYQPRELSCAECDAPPWMDTSGPGGVYIVQAECGLVKIGLSKKNVRVRVFQLAREAEKRGHRLELLDVLWGATWHVERWLHTVFLDVRDIPAALEAGLPNHTEWFWSTPALDRLSTSVEFMREGSPWEEVHDLDPCPWEPVL